MTPVELERVQRADPDYTPDLEIVTDSTLAKVREYKRSAKAEAKAKTKAKAAKP